MGLIKEISGVFGYFVEKDEPEHAELVYNLRKMVSENTVSLVFGQKGCKPGFKAIFTAALMCRRIKRYIEGVLPPGLEGAFTLFLNFLAEMPEDNSIRLSISLMPFKELSSYEINKIDDFIVELNGTSFLGEQGPFGLAKINYTKTY